MASPGQVVKDKQLRVLRSNMRFSGGALPPFEHGDLIGELPQSTTIWEAVRRARDGYESAGGGSGMKALRKSNVGKQADSSCCVINFSNNLEVADRVMPFSAIQPAPGTRVRQPTNFFNLLHRNRLCPYVQWACRAKFFERRCVNCIRDHAAYTSIMALTTLLPEKLEMTSSSGITGRAGLLKSPGKSL